MRLLSSIPSSEIPCLRRLARRGLLLLAPLAGILLAFLTLDPFHLVWPVESPLVKGALMNDRLFQTRWLLSHRGGYDAFILGSSRSKAFRTTTWAPFLQEEARPFHMGVNDESLFGVARKLEFLEREGFAVRHVLLALDRRILERATNPPPHIFREHPAVSGESSGEYYKRYVIAFVDPRFLFSYSVWRLSGRVVDGARIWTEDFEYVPETGDHIYAGMDRERGKDPDRYYERRATIFRDRGPRTVRPVINTEGHRLLSEMAGLFRREGTDLRVVVTPNFDQVPLHPRDLTALHEAFGAGRTTDFSGTNPLTSDVRNYYEERHFLPAVADRILERLYERGLRAESSPLPRNSPPR